MFKTTLAACVVLAVTGCAGTTYWVPDTHQSADNFRRVQAGCRVTMAGIMGSYSNEGGFAALSNAAIGMQSFTNCMEANGFVEVAAPRAADPETATRAPCTRTHTYYYC
jgi:hypothetical protein